MKRARGFTLIELLIALAVFAVLAMLAYGGLNALLMSRSLSDERADAVRALQLAYRTIERDVEQPVPRAIRDEFGTERPAFSAGDAVDALLELTRGGWRNPAEQTRSTLQRVAYVLRDDTLVRQSWLNLDRAPNDQPVEQDLLPGVRELRMRFLDGSDTWQERWPVAEAGAAAPAPGAAIAPPRAIEWIMETERWGELRWLFRLPG